MKITSNYTRHSLDKIRSLRKYAYPTRDKTNSALHGSVNDGRSLASVRRVHIHASVNGTEWNDNTRALISVRMRQFLCACVLTWNSVFPPWTTTVYRLAHLRPRYTSRYSNSRRTKAVSRKKWNYVQETGHSRIWKFWFKVNCFTCSTGMENILPWKELYTLAAGGKSGWRKIPFWDVHQFINVSCLCTLEFAWV